MSLLVDPIDGTTNFVKQKDHFCILIAYYENNVGKLGYIYDVMNDALYHAIQNNGAYLNGVRLSPPPLCHLEDGLVSVDIRNWAQKEVCNELVAKSFDIRYFGCGGIDSIHVFTGKFAAFVNSRSAPWDLAAQLIFTKELDLVATTFDGREVNYLEGGNWILANKLAHNEILAILNS